MPENQKRLLGQSIIVIGVAFAMHGLASAEKFQLEVEAGAVFASRNDAKIPGDTGTLVSLVDELDTPAAPAFRLRVNYRPASRHFLSVLYAPLQVNATGVASREIEFAGGSYPRGTPLLAVYRFNSYRLTYRYSLLRRPDIEFAVGVTGKIRDAEISLYGADARRKTDLGFVPLLNVHFEWRPQGSAFGIVVDADALAAPQGRAEDILVAATWAARDRVGLRVGYRTVEGGADNDQVYTFAWLHYFVAGMVVGF